MRHFPFFVAGWIFLVGLYGIVTSRNLIHLVVCVSVVQSATYVFLISIGYLTGASPPIFTDQPPGSPAVDPVVQALALTDIVVSATVLALLLAIAVDVRKRAGTLDPDELAPLRMKRR
jgi:multicomponent Na+:H+ antiporter subunit C